MSVKDAINALVDKGGPAAGLPTRADKAPIGRAVGIARPSAAAASGVGLASPLRMVITATTPRTIPVPVGADSVEIEDAAEFELIDALGNVYVVESVSWPS